MTALIDKEPAIVQQGPPNGIAFCTTMPLMDSDETASRIRVMRSWLGLNQTEFGALINRSRGAVGKWEEGEPPRDDFLLAELARRAGFSPTYFIDEKINIPSRREAAENRRGHWTDLEALKAFEAEIASYGKSQRAGKRRAPGQAEGSKPSNGNS